MKTMIDNNKSFIIMAMMIGAIAGLVSAYLTWNLIYAIGSRVVQDQEYYDYAAVMNACGGFCGALLGLGLGLGSRRPVVAVLIAHAIAPVPFFLTVFPVHSWQDGIAEHFLTICATAMVCAVVFHFSNRRKEANRTPDGICQPVDGSPKPLT
jgi:hypothetical protein